MKKSLIIAATAVVLLGGSAAGYHAYARYDGGGHGRHHSRMTAADMGAYADARIAALRAGLALTPDQQKLWPPVETALKEIATKHVERRETFRTERRDRDRAARPDPIERLRKGADRMSETGADLKRLADVTDPLYQSLDDAQKRRFSALSHAGMRGMRHHREGPRWRRHGDMGDEGRHMGPHGRGEGGPGWRRHTDFEGGHLGRDGRGPDGPGMRQRIEWTPAAPQGSERL